MPEKSKSLLMNVIKEREEQDVFSKKIDKILGHLQVGNTKIRGEKQKQYSEPIFEEIYNTLKQLNNKDNSDKDLKEELEKLDTLKDVVSTLKEQNKLTETSQKLLEENLLITKKQALNKFKEKGGVGKNENYKTKTEQVNHKIFGSLVNKLKDFNPMHSIGSLLHETTGISAFSTIGSFASQMAQDVKEKKEMQKQKKKEVFENILNKTKENDNAEPLSSQTIIPKKSSPKLVNPIVNKSNKSLGMLHKAPVENKPLACIEKKTDGQNKYLINIDKNLNDFVGLYKIVNDEELVAKRDKIFGSLRNKKSNETTATNKKFLKKISKKIDEEDDSFLGSLLAGTGGGLMGRGGGGLITKLKTSVIGVIGKLGTFGLTILPAVGAFTLVAGSALALGLTVKNLSKKWEEESNKEIKKLKINTSAYDTINSMEKKDLKNKLNITPKDEKLLLNEMRDKEKQDFRKKISDKPKWARDKLMEKYQTKIGKEKLDVEIKNQLMSGKGLIGKKYGKKYKSIRKEHSNEWKNIRRKVITQTQGKPHNSVSVRKLINKEKENYDISPKQIKTVEKKDFNTEGNTVEKTHPQLLADAKAAELGLVKSSGYRSPSYNASVGGSPRSYHLLGQAGDYQGPEGTLREFRNWASQTGKYVENKAYPGRNFTHLSWKEKPIPGSIPSGAKRSLMVSGGVKTNNSVDKNETLKQNNNSIRNTVASVNRSINAPIQTAKIKTKQTSQQHQIRQQSAQTQSLANIISNRVSIIQQESKKLIVQPDRSVGVNDIQTIMNVKNGVIT